MGDWRLRTRIVALILLPTFFAVVFGALSLVSAVRAVGDYERVGELTEVTTTAQSLVHELAYERDLSARYIADGRKPDAEQAVQKQGAVVDQAAETFRRTALGISDSHSAQVRGQIERVLSRLPELQRVRGSIQTTNVIAASGIKAYTLVINDVIALVDGTSQGSTDDDFNRSVRAVGSLVRAKEALSRQRGIQAAALAEGGFDWSSLNALVSAQSQRESELTAYLTDATVEQRQLYADTVTGGEVDRTNLLILESVNRANARPESFRLDVGKANNPRVWFKAATENIRLMRQVEERLLGDLSRRAADLRAAEIRSALIAGTVTLVLLVLVVIVTISIASSMVRPLGRLKSEALAIAGVGLPQTVRSMREDGGVRPPEVKPIGVHTKDEIGEVARAFDAVHREAVRLAAQEAQLRSNVNAMFVNLSRRSQNLVERQLRIIDGLEQGEEDSGRLENFFKLDHLATRMRRNSENLLVLAGQDQPRRWGRPVGLVDVLRAAVSEVEQYQRVSMRLQPGIMIVGQAVNDVVHLVAELVENATMFSPEGTPVVIGAHPVGGGEGESVMLSITDSGIGMVPGELSEANRRLSEPQAVDVSVSRRMGLFVVSRLASRHGIRVQLRPSQITGITALIMLPPAIVRLEGGEREYAPSHRQVVGMAPAPRSEPGAPKAPGVSENRPERLPIFESLESYWFRRRYQPDDPAGAQEHGPPADRGWAVAETVIAPETGGETPAGLPRRMPMANLVPGSVGDRHSSGRTLTGGHTRPPSDDPDLVRTRLSGFQRGVRQAREDSGHWTDNSR